MSEIVIYEDPDVTNPVQKQFPILDAAIVNSCKQKGATP